MKRSMLQVYVNGAVDAIRLYEQAFDARLLEIHHAPDGKVLHSELNAHGQVLSVADRTAEDGEADITGNVMQFCLHFAAGEEAAVQKAYNALAPGAKIYTPLGPCSFSSLMTDLVDRFGVRWCIFVC